MQSYYFLLLTWFLLLIVLKQRADPFTASFYTLLPMELPLSLQLVLMLKVRVLAANLEGTGEGLEFEVQGLYVFA